MKEIKRFVCEICNTEYIEKEQCIECEKSHIKPDGVKGFEYAPTGGYPKAVHIKMSNGQTITYRR